MISALARNGGESAKPIVAAVFALTTKSNSAGCPIGKSAGAEPPRICADVIRRLPVVFADRRAIGHQASGLGIFAAGRDRRQPLFDGERGKLSAPREKQRPRRNDKARNAIMAHGGERRAELVGGLDPVIPDREPEGRRGGLRLAKRQRRRRIAAIGENGKCLRGWNGLVKQLQRLALTPGGRSLMPVTLGLRCSAPALSCVPRPTPVAITIGMVEVARLATAAAGVPAVTSTSTLRPISSATAPARRSVRPSAQRKSNATPSLCPNSCRRRLKISHSATRCGSDAAVSRMPMRLVL